jgi:hypothetical protein
MVLLIAASFAFILYHVSLSSFPISITSHFTTLLEPYEPFINGTVKAPAVSAIVKAILEYDGWKTIKEETSQTANINKYTEDLIAIFAKFVAIPPPLPINEGLYSLFLIFRMRAGTIDFTGRDQLLRFP